MASDIVRNFHNEQMAQERERVALRIANGTKASSSEIIGQRMRNPSFKGLPDNSTGSKNRPFFANKDESNVSLEEKVALRGGVVRNYKYAQKILGRLAEGTQAIDLAKEGIPVPSKPIPELTALEEKQLEFNDRLYMLGEVVQNKVLGRFDVKDINELPRLLMTIAPSLRMPQIADLSEYLDELALEIQSQIPGGAAGAAAAAPIRGRPPVPGGRTAAERAKIKEEAAELGSFKSVIFSLVNDMINFLVDYTPYAQRDFDTRKKAAAILAREYFRIPAKDANKAMRGTYPKQEAAGEFTRFAAPGEQFEPAAVDFPNAARG
jgi:hypothetical protein